MKRTYWLALPMLPLALGGCPYNRYRITMTPCGDRFERTLTVARLDDQPARTPAHQDLPSNELTAIAKLYAEHETTDDGTVHVFSGVFEKTTPDDVGGAGFYRRYAADLGVAYVYSERFRGDDDLAGQMRARQAAADAITGHLIGWFAAELGNEPGWDKLRTWMDNAVRRDIANIGMYAWVNKALNDVQADGAEEVWSRMLQFFCERRYLQPDDMPLLVAAISNQDKTTETAVLGFLKRLIADQMGVPADKPAPKALSFLNSGQSAEASLKAYVRTTDAYRKLQTGAQGESPEPLKVLEEPAATLMDLGAGTPDVVQVTLKLGAKPDHTNGQWDAECGAATWSRSIPPGRDSKAPGLPAYVYASWAEPNVEAQARLFGRTALDGEALWTYCLLHARLTPEQQIAWAKGLSALGAATTDGDRRTALANGSADADWAKSLVDLLNTALGSEAADK